MDIKAAVEEASKELLPEKSREIYEKQYRKFNEWCASKTVENLNEDVLLAYFYEKSKEFKASTLWSHYSMVKSKLILEKNLDISKFLKLTAFLKRKNDGYSAKKSKTLDADQVQKFLTEASDEDYLLIKVRYLFLLH
jgi:hypothetical protein